MSDRVSSIRPVGHRLLVKPDDVEVMSAGGIVIAFDTKREKSAQETGLVVAHGPQAFLAFCCWTFLGFPIWGKPWCKVGDRVVYTKYAGGGNHVKDPNTGVEYIILNDADIKAVLDPKEGE